MREPWAGWVLPDLTPMFRECCVFVPGQKHFAVSSGSASILTGLLVIPCASAGMVGGGYTVKRWKLTNVGIARFITVVSACALVCMLFLLVHCDTPVVFGVNSGYLNSNGTRQPLPPASATSRESIASACNAG
jgi:hypothetical protein